MVRVRFAPSPTGYLHVGNARTALFSWLYARARKGSFVLRIEDTDLERSREEYVEAICRDLRWLGVDWDEGPDVGGAHGPYRQSERLHLYGEHLDRLSRAGLAYPCFCSPEELEERRAQAAASGRPHRYDNRCRDLRPEQVERLKAEGRKASIRFKVPDEKVVVDDLVYGRMVFDAGLIGDFVIMKSDGMPTYHFAVVVDDALMEITHVIRGEGHISNTPLHILLFRALGYEPPLFAHMAHTLGADGGKLSKRHGAFSLAEYRRLGYLPEAIANYIALLGWSPKKESEIFSLQEAVGIFDVKDLSKASARFDPEKLNFLGGHYIRQADPDRLAELAVPYLEEAGLVKDGSRPDRQRLREMLAVVQPRLCHVSQVVEELRVFFESPSIAAGQGALAEESAKRALAAASQGLQADTAESLSASIKAIGKETGVKGKSLYMPLRVALTGKEHGPELHLIAPLLGTEECRRRIKAALNT